jgi:F-type H+-transporting ATPase subunit alpha
MVDVRPDEISEILKQQISGFTSTSELEEYGTVLTVGDGIARVYGLTKHRRVNWWNLKQVFKPSFLNLEEDNVGVVLMGSGDGIREGSRVHRTGRLLLSVW